MYVLYTVVILVYIMLLKCIHCKVSAVLQRWLCCGHSWQSQLLHVFVGALCLFSVAIVIYMHERQLIASIRTEIWPLLRRQRPSIKAKEL